jgi:hypothetical protein
LKLNVDPCSCCEIERMVFKLEHSANLPKRP